jgi:hypothetical protein
LERRQSDVGRTKTFQLLELRENKFSNFRQEGHGIPVHIELDIVLRDEDGDVRQQSMAREIRDASGSQVLTGDPGLEMPF